MKNGFWMALFLAAIGSVGCASVAVADETPVAPPAPAVAPAPELTLAETAPEVVANVNGTRLSRDQLAALCVHFHGKAVLETLIQRELIRQEAAKLGVTVSKEEIDASVKKSVREQLDANARMGGAKNFEDMAKQKGMKPEEAARQVRDWEDWLRPFGEPELLARKILLKSVKVTEAEVRAEFERRYGPKARVLQIVLESRNDAQEAVQKLKLGADFGDLARDISVDNVSRRKGGEIEPLGGGSPLGDAALRLKPGQFSEPVKTPDGYHVLKLLEIIPAVDKNFDEVKGEIRENLITLRMVDQREKWIQDLFDKAAITRNM